MRWAIVRCWTCSGHGVIDVGGLGGVWPGDCHTCEGEGEVYVSESDRLKAWPGGAFTGHAPGLFAQVEAGVEQGRIIEYEGVQV